MPEIVDLDAARVERASKRNGELPRVKFMDVVYELPEELPVDFSIKLGQLDSHPEYLDDIGSTLFGAAWSASVRSHFTNGDASALFGDFKKLYGTDSGESPASAEG